MASCGGKYKINGKTNLIPDGETILLQKQNNEQFEIVDSATVTNGSFSFKGEQKSPAIAILVHLNDKQSQIPPQLIALGLINGTGFGSYGRETGGVMLSVTGLNHFYYVRDFTDMRCKHSRVLSIIRERLHREPRDGDVFIVMSRNRRIVRMFSFDNRSYSLFEKKFVAGYQFMKVERNGADTVYRIAWKDVVLILENPIVKTLKIR